MADKTDRELLQETHDAVTSMNVMVRAHDRTLYGNGQPGLVGEFSRVQERQRECPARARTKRDNAMLVVTWAGVIVAALACLITFASRVR